MTSFEDLLAAPQEALDGLIEELVRGNPGLARLIGTKLGLTSKARRTSILGIAPTLPGLPVLLLRRSSCQAGLLGRECEGDKEHGHDPHKPRDDVTYWTLLGPWTEALYDTALALSPKNTQRWEAIGAARPFSVVHTGIVAPNFDKPGFGPQVIVKPADVSLLVVRRR
jgi:hypothetical protein